MAHFTDEEQKITGLPSPIAADAINTDIIRFRLDKTLDHLEDLRMSDDDELTHAERAALPGKMEKARQEQLVLNGIVEQLTVHGMWRALNT